MIGVMQGRLLPKYQGRYQAHPIGYWKDEFPIAKKAGLDCIEFIFDYNDAEQNPLIRSGGIDEILAVSEETGVVARTICADYFMDAPLHAENDSAVQKSMTVLHQLFAASEQLGVTDIVIPCVDQSSLKSDGAITRFFKMIQLVLDQLENKKINLSLETDLAPQPFAELINKFENDRITINYDIGNSAALGYDPVEELSTYGDRITDIHIKDRVYNGGSVTLGEGDADFDRFFTKLNEYNYCGPFIMQAYRDDKGVDIFEQQLEWIKPYLGKLCG